LFRKGSATFAMCQLQLLGFLITILQIGFISAQHLPYVACPGLFRYLEYQNEYIGHLKLVLDNTNAENEVRIELSQPGDRAPVSFPDSSSLQ